ANEIAGATLIIKDLNGKEISSFISTTIPKYINLEAGEYILIEKYAPNGYKLNDTVVYFKVDKEGNVSVKDSSGKYVDVEYITIINEGNDVVNISKLDSSTNSYLTGAKLVLKNEKGEIVATWTTSNESYNIALNAGDYTISETVAPKGYILNKEITYIRVLDDGTLMVKNKNGVYEISNGIIIYNEPELEEEIVVVPKTGLTSILTYTFGSLTTLGGAYLLLRNGQFSI
ncbi:MAG: SpaA isopeptide-forming pilin-related protein, partial [Bacilli bacterium]|nr:SpaA isopeptide-forming pilin-related protein [Bacilli bacterium]